MNETELKKTISKRIIEARDRLNLNQAQLAEKADVTPAAISQIESCQRLPSTPVIRRIAQALNVSIDYLIGRSEETELSDIIRDDQMSTFFRNFNSLSKEDRENIEKHVAFMSKIKKNQK